MKALLAHDDRAKLYGLARALEDGGIAVAGEAHTAEQVTALVGRTRPTIVLLAQSFAAANDWLVLHDIAARAGAPATFVLLPEDAHGLGVVALAHGARGCIAAETDPLDIPALLRQAFAGNFYCTAPAEPEPAAHDELTEREWSVLDALARGLSNEAIGRELWLSSHTVKSHLHRIYLKLGVSNRTEAARYAIESGHAPAAPHPLVVAGAGLR